VVVVNLEALSTWTEKRLGTIALTTGDSRIFVYSNIQPAVRLLLLHYFVLFYDDISNRLHNMSIGRTEIDLAENGCCLAG
jgi:hypothetical protein